MIRMIILSVVVAVVGSLASSAHAQQPLPSDMSWGQRYHFDYYRNKMWPMPFRTADTTAVLSYFDVQRNNGWRLHNTLGVGMFDPVSHELTESGKAHVRWIVTRAPQNRRIVFVLEGTNQSETATRVESAQLAISELVPVGPLPQIYLTNEDAPGSSGVYQTAISRAMANSVPNPRLTADATLDAN